MSDWRCKDCDQWIYRNNQTNHITNAVSGVGGNRGQDHICPNRFKSGAVPDQERLKKKYMCHRCLLVYPGRFVDCPFCFKLICQKCGWQQDWVIDEPKNTCGKCGHKYLEWTVVSKLVHSNSRNVVIDSLGGEDEDKRFPKYKRLLQYGTHVKKTQHELGWRQVLPPVGVKQIFDCNNYGHVLRPKDTKCRVCGVGVIRA